MEPIPDSETSGNVPQPAEADGTIPQVSAPDGTVRNDSEVFRTSPKNSEPSRDEPKDGDWQFNYTLTVREAARFFENAGVPRTERSIVNWCRPNRQDMKRLECYFDPNERKYFITPESVEAVIQEERSKEQRSGGPVPKAAESDRDRARPAADAGKAEELEREVNNLKMTNHVKDRWIEELQRQNRIAFDEVKSTQYQLGRLEERLQLEAPGRTVEASDSDEEPEVEITSQSPGDRPQDLDLREDREGLPS